MIFIQEFEINIGQYIKMFNFYIVCELTENIFILL